MVKDQREDIFRKEMIERLSAPDELTELLRITSRPDWLVLIAIALIVITALVWASIAHIPVTTHGVGVLATGCGAEELHGCNQHSVENRNSQPEHLAAVLFIADNVVNQVRPGLQVQIMPRDPQMKKYGLLTGTVSRIRQSSANNNVLQQMLPAGSKLAEICVSRQLCSEVEVVLSPPVQSQSGGSSATSRSAIAQAGTEIEGEIVLKEIHPIQWVIPWAR